MKDERLMPRTKAAGVRAWDSVARNRQADESPLDSFAGLERPDFNGLALQSVG
jgi:hypothetical protein